jgi:hypothetical protein
VVVYKVDRLTRSLANFAMLIEPGGRAGIDRLRRGPAARRRPS